MQSTIKSIIPALVFLFLGMFLFFLAGTIHLPFSIDKYAFAFFASVVLYALSIAFIRFENISLSRMNLIPDSGTFKRLCLGLIIGAALTGLMLFVFFSLTPFTVIRNAEQNLIPFLLSTSVFIPLAFMEEVLFRGYPFFRMSQCINIRWAIFSTAVLFGLYHYDGTQNIGFLLLGPGIWGVTFGVAAYLSKSIAVPLGIHISCNLIQALFGLKEDQAPLWTLTKINAPLSEGINPEHLGITMQLLILFASIAVLELTLKSRSSKKQAQSNTMNL